MNSRFEIEPDEEAAAARRPISEISIALANRETELPVPAVEVNPAPVEDLRPDTQKAHTRHIENFKPRSQESAAPESAESFDYTGEHWTEKPVSLRKSYSHLRHIQSLPDRRDEEFREKRRSRITELADHITKLGQADRIYDEPEPAEVASRRDAIWEDLKSKCATQIENLRSATAAYHLLRAALIESALLPGEKERALEACDRELGGQVDSAVVEQLLIKKARLNQISHSACVSGVRELTIAFDAIEAPLRDVEQEAGRILDTQEQALVAAEKKFFSSYGLSHEPTKVSAGIAILRAKLKNILCAYNQVLERRSRPFPAGEFPNLCTTFGAELFAASAGN